MQVTEPDIRTAAASARLWRMMKTQLENMKMLHGCKKAYLQPSLSFQALLLHCKAVGETPRGPPWL